MASRTVLITGASRGIGLSAAESMLAEGANVVAMQRTQTVELESLLARYPTSFCVAKGDFTKPEDVESALKITLDRFGVLDSLVLNAATCTPFGTIEGQPLSGWEYIFNINVFSNVGFLKVTLPTLRESKLGARVVLVSSAAAERGVRGCAAYGSSKAALNCFNSYLAVEEPSITSIAVHPGGVRTQMANEMATDGKGKMDDAVLEALLANIIEPAVPGSAIARLALRAPPEYSGKYLHYNDPLVTSL